MLEMNRWMISILTHLQLGSSLVSEKLTAHHGRREPDGSVDRSGLNKSKILKVTFLFPHVARYNWFANISILLEMKAVAYEFLPWYSEEPRGE